MNSFPLKDELPLRWWTPASWAEAVLSEPLALLSDHAHLEKKAAVNALDLLTRWPEPNPPENWVNVMSAVARDESEHLGVVTRLLARRGGKLAKGNHNAYAAGLRELLRLGDAIDEVMDRLMISALIEARSCERFAVLALNSKDAELAKLYKELYASEAGHYRVFVDLARQLPGPAAVDERWHDMLDAEAKIIQRQTPGPRIHSGV